VIESLCPMEVRFFFRSVLGFVRAYTKVEMMMKVKSIRLAVKT
jgi:hypothetical protein